MTVKRSKCAGAFTLTEVMVAMVVLAIASLGALGYQYYAARHSSIASAQITATRTAQLLLEDWKSTGGASDYDPTILGLGFSSGAVPTGYTYGQGMGSPLGSGVYSATVDSTPMVVMLSWTDVATDTVTQTKLRQLAVIVKFGNVSKGTLTEPTNMVKNLPPVILTTYARVDASGG
jgi:prepilin-type N-terminal cleavage/methylation domain-containing protein